MRAAKLDCKRQGRRVISRPILFVLGYNKFVMGQRALVALVTGLEATRLPEPFPL